MSLDYNFEQPILCNYYDTFSPSIDLSEKYKFISTSELHTILKDGAKTFVTQNGWVIDLFSDVSNVSFDLPRKALHLIESYALRETTTENAIGSSEWIYFKSATVNTLNAANSDKHVASLTKKAIADIAHLMTSVNTLSEPSSDVILTHMCKAIISPEGMTVPFFENVMNAFVQKHVLLSAEAYTCIPTQSVDMGLSLLFRSFLNHKILDEEETVVGILTPCTSSFLEYVARSHRVNCIAVEENGMILESEFEKLKNPKMSVLLLSNMSNIAISQHTIDKINKLIAESRHDLIIIQDASLYPFCEKTPRFKNNNTISLFSFKKFFGGCVSQAMIVVPTNNIVDTLYIPTFYENEVVRAQVFKHYAPAYSKVSQLNFAKKVMYDSVDISGRDSTCIVSLQDQVLMCLYAVMDHSKYIQKLNKVLSDRVTLVKSYLGTTDLPQNNISVPTTSTCNFYMNINFIQTANALVGKDDFGDYIFKTFNPYELYVNMAENSGLVILPGSAMNRDVWDIRVNVASLTDEECGYVGNTLNQQILKLLEKYKDYVKKLDSIKFGIK